MKLAEQFYSIEGEGVRQGEPTYFIRSQGCSIRCNFCDSKNTWNKNEGYDLDVDDLISIVKEFRKKFPFKYVSITGGNPMENKDLKELLSKLVIEDFIIHLEHPGIFLNVKEEMQILKRYVTSCCFDLKPPGIKDIDLEEYFKIIEELNLCQVQIKSIIRNKEDIKFYSKIFKNRNLKDYKVILSPCFNGDNTFEEEIANNIIDNMLKGNFGNNCKLSLQIHKLLNRR